MKKTFINPFLVAFLFGILGLHLVREFNARRLTAPPALVEVPDWELTSHENKPFGSKDLKGKVVITSFFFTRCPTICPKMTQSMLEVQKRFTKLKDKSAFLTITIDPEFDTPEVLSDFRLKYDTNWTYLTGAKKDILSVVEGKMKLPMGDGHHVAELVLFDQVGDLRGKFGTDPTSLAALERAAKHLIDNP
ncbi:MAG: SCO family protein [Myxococcota bacterium]